MKHARILALTLVVLLAFPLAGHSTTETVSLAMLTEALALEVGQAARLEWELTPAGAGLRFESGDAAVAAVDETGEVTGVAVGETVVTVRAGGAVCEVAVAVREAEPDEPEPEPEDVEEQQLLVGEAEIHLTPGEACALSVSLAGGLEGDPRYESDQPDIAAVDEDGLVTALAIGEAVITVSLGEFAETVEVFVYEDETERAVVTGSAGATGTARNPGGNGNTAQSGSLPIQVTESAETPADVLMVQPDALQTPAATTVEIDLDAYAYEVFELVNRERSKAGLGQVSWHSDLARCADIRAEEMSRKWGHERPSPPQDRSKSWPANVNGVGVYNAPSVADELGIPYGWIMENAGMGYRTPEAAVQGWMNSSGHRDNILRNTHTRCGVGVYQNAGGTFYWALWLDREPTSSNSSNNSNNNNNNTGNGTATDENANTDNDNNGNADNNTGGSSTGETGKSEHAKLLEELQKADYSLGEKTLTLTVGEERQVPFHLSGVTDNLTVEWTVSGSSVTVDGDGYVTAQRTGFSLVNIKIHIRGVYLDTLQCHIYVEAATSEPDPPENSDDDWDDEPD